MTRRLMLALVVLAALAVVSAQRQPLTPPIYYLVTAPDLVEGVPVHGELTPTSGQNFKDGSYLDVIVLRSGGEESVEIRVESDDFDTYLSLVGPDGRLLDTNDDAYDGGALFASRLRAYLRDAGTYLVVVSGAMPGDLGGYSVTRSLFVPPPKVAVDAEVPGVYGGYLNEEQADSYWITVPEDATVVARLRSQDFDTVLEVYGSNGEWVADNDDFDGTDSQVIVDLTAGRYEFLVKGYWDTAYGPYTLAFDFYDAPPIVVVEVDAPGAHEGVLAASAVDTYVLHLTAPATVKVDLWSLEFDTYLEAFDAAGGWIDGNDDFDGTDSRLVLELEAGVYEFDVAAFGQMGAGGYVIEFDW